MRQEGELLTCDRCGTSTFRKLVGSTELDGGFTHVNHFEDVPEGWTYASDLGKTMNFCPSCSLVYKKTLENFMNSVPTKFEK